ncbi:hypothetical protein TDB9533_01706 [Thalassocella blandensis]|nr:hypothetical protein TDB9533_01706 [Thalassocella blandensis]
MRASVNFLNTASWRKRGLLVGNALMFQGAWFALMFASDSQALLLMCVLLAIHYYLYSPSFTEWKVIALVGILGLFIDSFLIHFQYLPLEPNYWLGMTFAPWWLVCLWMAFAMTLYHSMAFLQKHLGITVLLSAIAAPWAYFAGGYLRGVTLTWQGLLAIAFIWAIWLPALVYYISRNRVTELNNSGIQPEEG